MGDAMVVHKPEQLKRALSQLNKDALQPSLQQAMQALQPVQRWMDGLKGELAGPLQAASVLAAQTKRPLLLVIDDEEFMRKLLTQVLVAARYDVDSVASAEAALAWLLQRQPDLILMDVQMPDTDCINLTRQLKAAKAYAGIPIVMLTGRGQKQIIVDALAAGASDFVVKPFDREILLKKVGSNVARSSKG